MSIQITKTIASDLPLGNQLTARHPLTLVWVSSQFTACRGHGRQHSAVDGVDLILDLIAGTNYNSNWKAYAAIGLSGRQFLVKLKHTKIMQQ